MKIIPVILFCCILIGCSQNSADKIPIKPLVISATPEVVRTVDLSIEENLVTLDNGKSDDIQNLKKSLDYLVENTTSSRQEIADIANKILPELKKTKSTPTRQEFLWVCKAIMQTNNYEKKLGEKPDFAYVAALVASDLEGKH